MKFLKALALMAVLLTCAVLLLGVSSLRRLPAAPSAVTPAGNGDVNCDGQIDVTDAIYTLQWLFVGGDKPCVAQDAGTQELIDEVKGLRTDLAAKWPPKPRDIVNLMGYQAVAFSSSAFFYTVPSDRWLIITKYDIVPTEANYLLIDNTPMKNTSNSFDSSTGWAVPPGSKLGFKNEYALNGGASYRIIGYLANP